ncbi:hypothetical protein SO802_021900 [Lithocarpus litseifolius]|uniref:Uncharacterized protein n=1 Tax=Lithocarpus litseifolius TaxID=425828 RepID=A0AAW2CJ45_9ROSI
MWPYELCHKILIAFMAAVGWFWGGKLRQQNNENPSLSYSYAPTISDSTNSQCNATQAGSANNSTFNQNLTAGQVTRTNAARHSARGRRGNSECSPMTEHEPDRVGSDSRSPKTQAQPFKTESNG